MQTATHQQLRQRFWNTHARRYLELIRAAVASDPGDGEMKVLLAAIERDVAARSPALH